jgi:solute:Na+ symporter, SSS family
MKIRLICVKFLVLNNRKFLRFISHAFPRLAFEVKACRVMCETKAQRGQAVAEFGILNWGIVISFLVANLALGYVLGRKVNTAESFYIGNKTTPWWAIGMSVMATYVSALSFLGGPAWAYKDGLAALAIHLNYPIVIFLVITYFLPFFYNSGVPSIYEYQERRFGPTARSVMSLVFLVSQALTTAAILYATALVVKFMTGMDVIWAIVLITVIALLYTTMGGMLAVIWTDTFQGFVLLFGAFVIMYALIMNAPSGILETLSALKAEGKLDAIRLDLDITEPTTIWSGVIAMSLFHVTVYGANQMMVQRTLGSKTIGDAKKSYLFMGYGAFLIYFLFFFIGVLAYAFYQGKPFENSNEIILIFARDYGFPGLSGILAAAVLAASMSTLSSAFNSLATVSTVDFYQRYFKTSGTESHYLNTSRLFTVVWAVLIIVPALLYAQTQGSILEVLSKIGAYFVGAKLGMYGLGFFSKHATEKGLLVGVAAGFVVIWYVATQTTIAWPWYCAIGGTVTIVIGQVASLILSGRQAEWSRYTINGQKAAFKAEGTPEKIEGWYQIPGKIDAASYGLLVFFVLTIAALVALNAWV